MSTRCNIHFTRGKVVFANVYRHSDGYPEGVLPDLEKFLTDVYNQTTDTRFNDPHYLAAKYVVWQANKWFRGSGMLDFLGVGVTIKDQTGIEYIYTVDCEEGYDIVKPTITYRKKKAK